MDSIHIEKILERDINSLGCSLWGVELSGSMSSQTLRLFIDKDDGVSIEDCEKISHHVSKVLEAEEGILDDYFLEVSSPGLDRKFFKTDQYQSYIGKSLKVKFLTNDNTYKTIIGILTDVSISSIILVVDKEIVEVSFDSIKKARIHLTGI